MADDLHNPPLLQALSQLTGLRRAEGAARPVLAELHAHQDLWAITYAAFALLKDRPNLRVIAAAALSPYLAAKLTGDARSKRVQQARAAQLQRIQAIVAAMPGRIEIAEDGSYRAINADALV